VLVNEDGYESGHEDLFAVTDLPVVQDDDEGAAVWLSWEAEWRDVFVLDAENETRAVYNLVEHDLGDAADHAELKALFLAAAEDGVRH
jgi:hypothetical protein